MKKMIEFYTGLGGANLGLSAIAYGAVPATANPAIGFALLSAGCFVVATQLFFIERRARAAIAHTVADLKERAADNRYVRHLLNNIQYANDSRAPLTQITHELGFVTGMLNEQSDSFSKDFSV